MKNRRFKPGDFVRRTSGGHFGHIKMGDIRVVVGYNVFDSLIFENDTFTYSEECFILYQEAKIDLLLEKYK